MDLKIIQDIRTTIVEQKKLLLNPFYYKSRNKKLGKLLTDHHYWNPSYIDGDAIVSL